MYSTYETDSQRDEDHFWEMIELSLGHAQYVPFELTEPIRDALAVWFKKRGLQVNE